MYLLALDESGTHGTASCLVIAGLAVHELDARPLADVLEAVLAKHLSPLGLDPHAHELHSADLRYPSRGEPARGGYGPKPPSEWLGIERSVRNAVIDDTYDAIANYQPVDPAYSPVVLAAVIERKHRKFKDADEKAYNHVLHRFDDMLLRLNRKAVEKQQGVVLHDRRLKLEQSIQTGTSARWSRRPTRCSPRSSASTAARAPSPRTSRTRTSGGCSSTVRASTSASTPSRASGRPARRGTTGTRGRPRTARTTSRRSARRSVAWPSPRHASRDSWTPTRPAPPPARTGRRW